MRFFRSTRGWVKRGEHISLYAVYVTNKVPLPHCYLYVRSQPLKTSNLLTSGLALHIMTVLFMNLSEI